MFIIFVITLLCTYGISQWENKKFYKKTGFGTFKSINSDRLTDTILKSVKK